MASKSASCQAIAKKSTFVLFFCTFFLYFFLYFSKKVYVTFSSYLPLGLGMDMVFGWCHATADRSDRQTVSTHGHLTTTA